MFARARDLFVSNLAVSISEAISQSFPNAAPEGEPALWLHLIEEEQMRQTISDLLLDMRADNLNENYIADTVERLKQGREKRRLKQIRSGDLDTAQRQEYLLKLREHKPDTLKKQQTDDSEFG